MASPAYSIIFSAQVSGTASSGGAGDALLPASAGGLYVLATSAARGTRRTTGIALGTYGPLQPVEIQQSGTVDYDTFNMGAGSASWVRVSTAGGLERCTPAGSDDIVGWCDVDGTLHLACGFLTAAIVSGSASITGTDGEVVTKSGTSGVTATNVAAGSGYVSIGASPATVGALRLASTGQIAMWDGAANRTLFATAANGTLQIAQDNSGTTQMTYVNVFPTTSVSIGVGTTSHFYCSTTGAAINSGALAIGSSNTASTGALRLQNNTAIKAKSGTSGDVQIVTTTSGDQVHIGEPTTVPVVAVRASGYIANRSATHYFQDAAAAADWAIIGATYLSLPFGASPATTGAVRLPNNTGIYALNGSAQNVRLIGLDGFSNYVSVGNATATAVDIVGGKLAINASSSADDGAIRLGSAAAINARNNAGSGNLPLLRTDTADAVYVGTTASFGGSTQAGALHLYSTNASALGIGSTTHFYCTAAGAFIWSGTLAFGSSGTASTGALRLQNNTAIKARNAATNADISVIGTNASDQVTIGDATAGIVAVQTSMSIGASATSTTGAVRLQNTAAIKARNAANSADIAIATVSASNVVQVGDSGTGVALLGTTTLSSNGQSAQQYSTNAKGLTIYGVYDVQTTDATVTTVASGTAANNTVTTISTIVNAVKSDGTQGACYERRYTIRNNAGTCTAIGTVQTIGTDVEDAVAWDCTVDFSGTLWRVRVTGAAATTIRWSAQVETTIALI